MKIIILTPTFSKFSGIDRLVEKEAEDYSKSGNKVTIFTFEGDIKTRYADVVKMGMPKSSLMQRIYRLLFFMDIKKLNRYTKKLKDYELVISHSYPLNWLACLAKKRYGVKYVYHNAGIAYPKLFSSFFERLYMLLFIKLNNRTIKNADEIISISSFLRKELKNETGLNSRVEYCKINKSRFNKKVSGDKIRKRYGLGKKPLLLYVGRISPHKGIHLLIQAFNIVLKKIPEAELIIVGKHTFDNYSEKLKKMSNSSVIVAGYVPDEELPYYYAACDLYVTATLWEGFNLPAAEAQAMGKRVVAFELCSHPEVVKNGILVKPYDVKGFADAVVKLLEKNAKR